MNEMRRDRVSRFHAGIAPLAGQAVTQNCTAVIGPISLLVRPITVYRKSYMRGHIKVTLTIALH